MVPQFRSFRESNISHPSDSPTLLIISNCENDIAFEFIFNFVNYLEIFRPIEQCSIYNCKLSLTNVCWHLDREKNMTKLTLTANFVLKFTRQVLNNSDLLKLTSVDNLTRQLLRKKSCEEF